MTRTSVIEVGDEIINRKGEVIVLTEVVQGRHGFMIMGVLTGGLSARGFIVPELPPCDQKVNWHGWMTRDSMTLANGITVGALGLYSRGDPRNDDIEEYDAEWERTIDAIRSQEMQSRPTDIRLDS